MEQPKFRVWDGEKMLYPQAPRYIAIGANSWGFWDEEKLLADSSCPEHKLMPYIDMNDNHGVKIYEQDVVRAKRTEILRKWPKYEIESKEEMEVLFKVDYCQGLFFYPINDMRTIYINEFFVDCDTGNISSAEIKLESAGSNRQYVNYSDFMVVGNALENPELLKVEW